MALDAGPAVDNLKEGGGFGSVARKKRKKREVKYVKTKFMVVIGLVFLLALGFGALAEEERYGAWLDRVIVVEEASSAAAITRMEAGDFSIFAFALTDPVLFEQVLASEILHYERTFGTYSELSFNPVGPILPATGKLNPFCVPRIREAMNMLLDRDFIAEELHGGLAVPRYLALNTAFPDYARFAAVARELELKYAYDPVKAEAIIAEEMVKLGAERIDGAWYFEGEPVVISLLIRVEDARLEIGDYVGTKLEEIGFQTERLYKTSAEASPIWLRGDPADGIFHIYTGGWVTTVVSRDMGDNFDFFYTPRGLPFPLWQAYTPSPEFDEVADRLARLDYTTMEERAELFKEALRLSMEDSVRLWIVDRLGFSPRHKDVRVAADLAGGISGAYLWALTTRFVDQVGGDMTFAMPSVLPDPWNPLAGSNWIYDMMLIRATGDWGKMWDPFTGLHWPQRIERAEITIKEGLPVGVTLDWVSLDFVPEITVPGDAWVDWDAVEQRFITADEKYPEGLTTNLKSVVYYPADLYDIKWHDGSNLSIADFVMAMILEFDRAKEESAVFDEAEVPAFESFMKHFRGVRIVSQDPLVIETYTERAYLDAEWNAVTWFPYYSQGPAPWHTLSVGLLAEAAQELAFSPDKADELGVEWMSLIGGPSLPILERYLFEFLGGTIPYEPTLGQFATMAEVLDRSINLETWFNDKGHFWVGSGPFYLDKAHHVEKMVELARFADFPDPAAKWERFAAPWIAEAAVSGPAQVQVGAAAEFDIAVTFEGEVYPMEGIDFVNYLVIDAAGKVALSGTAEAVADGQWRVVLTAEQTAALPVGSTKLEVVVAPLWVSIPSFASIEFVTLP
jgi:peptide/nickel transport system substrate-binding protein